MTSLAQACVSLLEQRRETVATAESLTAGLIAASLADVPGASSVLRGGLAAYSTDVKTTVLGVDSDVIARDGVVSRTCAEAMASRARMLFSSDWAIAATGVAGPTEQDGQPVGLVYIAVAAEGHLRSEERQLRGVRQEIRARTVWEALTLLHAMLTAGSTHRE